MGSILDIGINSLYSSRQALTLSHQNIANANNPYYTRRLIDFSEVNNGMFGNGIKVEDVRRVVDEFANQSLLQAKSNFIFSEKNLEKLNELEVLVDSESTGLNKVVSQSLRDLNNLNANAASGVDRTVYLQQLKTVVERFHGLNQTMNEFRTNANRSINMEVNRVNEITQKIAYLNKQVAQSSSPDAPENMALLDQRDKLLNELAEEISFTSQVDSMGRVNIQVGKGVPLLQGVEVSTLKTKASAQDPKLYELEVDNGHISSVLGSLSGGGKIASLMTFQNEHLQSAQNALGRLAIGISDALNTQNKKGMDLNGELGQNIFTDINEAALKNDRVIFNKNNTGSGTLSVEITDIKKLTTSDYVLQFTSATDYQLIRSSDKTEVASGTVSSVPHTVDADGFQINISSANFAAGDLMLVGPTRDAADAIQLKTLDGSKLALAFPVAVSPSSNNIGDGEIEITSIQDISAPTFSVPRQLSPPVRIEFTSALSYRLVNANDDSVIEAGISYDPLNGQDLFPTPGGYDPGYRAHISGTMQAGDQYTLDYNASGAGDNRNGLLIAEQFHQGLLNEGKLTLAQAYNEVSGAVSAQASTARHQLDSQEVIKTQAQERRDQFSGVSIEEETMNIAKFEQSYIASAQILEVFRSMFQTVISVMRS